MYQVVDNFLDEQSYQRLKGNVTNDIAWFYRPHSGSDKDSSFFQHVIYHDNRITSDLYDSCLPVLEKLNVAALLHLRLNLLINRFGNSKSDWHTDKFTDNHTHKTAIMYFGENNGSTLFKINEQIEEVSCKDNRIVVFDSSILHTAKHHTDVDRRIVLNINYFPK